MQIGEDCGVYVNMHLYGCTLKGVGANLKWMYVVTGYTWCVDTTRETMVIY